MTTDINVAVVTRKQIVKSDNGGDMNVDNASSAGDTIAAHTLT